MPWFTRTCHLLFHPIVCAEMMQKPTIVCLCCCLFNVCVHSFYLSFFLSCSHCIFQMRLNSTIFFCCIVASCFSVVILYVYIYIFRSLFIFRASSVIFAPTWIYAVQRHRMKQRQKQRNKNWIYIYFFEAKRKKKRTNQQNACVVYYNLHHI